jgi:hypothetical protein
VGVFFSRPPAPVFSPLSRPSFFSFSRRKPTTTHRTFKHTRLRRCLLGFFVGRPVDCFRTTRPNKKKPATLIKATREKKDGAFSARAPFFPAPLALFFHQAFSTP